MMYANVFSSRLKKARDYSGISQSEAAKTLRISQSAFAAYESGRNEPSLEMLAMISKLFAVNSDWLIGLSSDSGINEMREILKEREQKRILDKLEKEAELDQRVWG